MSLRAHPAGTVPAETARVARAAFPKGHPYLHLRDAWGALFEDAQFAALFAPVGQPALAPWRLALVTLLQFAEGLSDRQAADAVRSRLDWKYLLGLPLSDPGFDPSVLCEFRGRLLAAEAEALLFEHLLAHCRAQGLLRARGRQRTDSTHVLAAVHTRNRLEMVGETLRRPLELLAHLAPEWLLAHAPSDWGVRYGQPFEQYRLPTGLPQRDALARQIGADGHLLLTALFQEAQREGPWAALWRLPAVQLLRQVWVQQYTLDLPEGAEPEAGEAAASWRWRTPEELPPAPQLIGTPTDPEARFSQKGELTWEGYKVHLTESCDPAAPRLITDVQTTPAPVPDLEVLPQIQADLARREVLPETQYVDAGYTEAAHYLRSAQEYEIRLVGPTQPEPSWQARAGTGFASRDFQVDWEAQQAVCPAGCRSRTWTETRKHDRAVVQVSFARRDCAGCEHRSACTRAQAAGRRLTLPLQAEYQALRAARAAPATASFQEEYQQRAGIEGTLAQGVRDCGLRRCRYLGLRKTRLQHLLTAAGLNFLRVGHWLLGRPLARTRKSALRRLLAAPAGAC